MNKRVFALFLAAKVLFGGYAHAGDPTGVKRVTEQGRTFVVAKLHNSEFQCDLDATGGYAGHGSVRVMNAGGTSGALYDNRGVSTLSYQSFDGEKWWTNRVLRAGDEGAANDLIILNSAAERLKETCPKLVQAEKLGLYAAAAAAAVAVDKPAQGAGAQAAKPAQPAAVQKQALKVAPPTLAPAAAAPQPALPVPATPQQPAMPGSTAPQGRTGCVTIYPVASEVMAKHRAQQAEAEEHGQKSAWEHQKEIAYAQYFGASNVRTDMTTPVHFETILPERAKARGDRLYVATGVNANGQKVEFAAYVGGALSASVTSPYTGMRSEARLHGDGSMEVLQTCVQDGTRYVVEYKYRAGDEPLMYISRRLPSGEVDSDLSSPRHLEDAMKEIITALRRTRDQVEAQPLARPSASPRPAIR